MSRKNFKVATTKDGKTTLTKIDKTPTNKKVKTLKDKETLKKEREDNYINFRVNAMKRRAKSRGYSKEQIEKFEEELRKQMDTPNQYSVLVMFNPDNKELVKEALNKEGIVWDILTTNYAYMIADTDTLATLREILSAIAKIHPYVKKKPPILPVMEKSGRGKKTKTKAQKKADAKAAKNIRKSLTRIKGRNTNVDELLQNSRRGISCFRKRVNEMRKSKEQKAAEKKARKKDGIKRKAYTGPFTGKTAAQKKKIHTEMKAHAELVKAAKKASKKAPGTTVPLNHKNASEGSKTTSTDVKKAA